MPAIKSANFTVLQNSNDIFKVVPNKYICFPFESFYQQNNPEVLLQ